MTTYRLMDGQSGRPGNGPASGTSYSGALVVGTMFCVSAGGLWFEGFWWWVPSANGDTASGQKFCLWQLSSASNGLLVPNSTVTAGTLTAGAWNYVPLATPLLLSPSASNSYGAIYLAATGKTFTSGFPETKNQFGSGDTYSAGITNGPLIAPSSSSGSAAAGSAFSWTKPQCPYTVASDPTVDMPGQNDSDANLWLDVQIADTPPSGATYRCFPNEPAFVVPGVSAQSAAYTLGLHFELTESCSLERIWHYSPPSATVLPTRCGIWRESTQTEVAGTDNSSPTWSGAAGSGWVSCDYTSSGVALAPGVEYIVSTFTSDNTDPWFLAQSGFWGSTPGPFPSGITQGPLEVLGNSAATPGNDSWNQSTVWTYPATSTEPEYDGIDVEVSPAAASTGTPANGGSISQRQPSQRNRLVTRHLAGTPPLGTARTGGAVVRHRPVRGTWHSVAAKVNPSGQAPGGLVIWRSAEQIARALWRHGPGVLPPAQPVTGGAVSHRVRPAIRAVWKSAAGTPALPPGKGVVPPLIAVWRRTWRRGVWSNPVPQGANRVVVSGPGLTIVAAMPEFTWDPGPAETNWETGMPEVTWERGPASLA
jgi:hypothetical protein